MSVWVPPNSTYPPPKHGEPPLHAAARLGNIPEIRRLVRQGANVNESFDISLDPGAYECPATPLMVAAGSGDGATVETVQALLDLGADPALELDGSSAADFACQGLGWNYRPGGDAARLRLLLDRGAALPTDPQDANRLLCRTASLGDPRRLKVLLDHGLNAGGFFDPEIARESAQQMADSLESYRESQPDFFKDLPEEMREMMSKGVGELFQEMTQKAATAPSSNEIPLFCAAESGSVECTELLLKAGASPTVRDSGRRTAMYYAVSLDVVRVLQNAGLPIEDADEFEWSPLVNALSEDEMAIDRVKALLEAGADVNATHDRGYTVFMSAVSATNRNLENMKLLIAHGADPHAVSGAGYNAFHAAIDVNGEANDEQSVRETLTYLRDLGVNMEHRNKSGHTPLARALEEGTGLEARVLCELGANPNTVYKMHDCGADECTRVDLPLLFHAVDGVGVDGDTKTETLLKHGADPLAVDDEGFTPLSRVLLALCSEADDYESKYNAFFDGLSNLDLELPAAARDRDGFIKEVMPGIRQYVEEFAADIPLDDASDFAAESRIERISCIALICAYDAWISASQPGH